MQNQTKLNHTIYFNFSSLNATKKQFDNKFKKSEPEVLIISSYPPRECGIATYSTDLLKALNNKFNKSFSVKIAALETNHEIHTYDDQVAYKLNTDIPSDYIKLAKEINENQNIKVVLIQHEFGFFEKSELDFQSFLYSILKPIVIVFHTVLPQPSNTLKTKVQQIAASADAIIVMTNLSAEILITDFDLQREKINVIQHGTHLVPHTDKALLKEKYYLKGKKVLSTFGLLSSGKGIETTLNALPAIIALHPDVVFLVIGKTHPSVIKSEGEIYRQSLKEIVSKLNLSSHVQFINYFMPLPDLLEYLQLTDVYLFTSKDPYQAVVSGTFSYALSCGCPIISTPIPHAKEVLKNDAGVIIDFENPSQLSIAVNELLKDDQLRTNISNEGLQRIASTAWENSAIIHALLFEKITQNEIKI